MNTHHAMAQLEINAATLSETQAAASQIMAHLSFPMCVYLNGEMGAGKTTLCKSLINAFGYVGEVTSPTYNLIQEYPIAQGVIYHMDPVSYTHLTLPTIYSV